MFRCLGAWIVCWCCWCLCSRKNARGAKGCWLNTLFFGKKSPKQFWVMQIIYTVRMDVRSSFINMVREKRLEYWNISEMFKGSSLFYLCTQIYHLPASLRVGSDQIFVIWTVCSELLNALTSNECTHIQVFAFSYSRIFEVCFLLLKVFCCVWKCFIGLFSNPCVSLLWLRSHCYTASLLHQLFTKYFS